MWRLFYLKIASHLPQGASLSLLDIKYEENNANEVHVSIDMKGDVYKQDFNDQIAVVKPVVFGFQKRQRTYRFIKNVTPLFL